MLDLDAAQKERLQALEKKLGDAGSLKVDEVFVSDRVCESIAKQKVILSGHNETSLLGILPFTPVVYDIVCPTCIDDKSFERFSALVRAGLLIPILRGPYSEYPDKIRDVIIAHPHVSRWEFRFLRHHTVVRPGARTRDIHQKMHALSEEMKKSVTGIADEKKYREAIGYFTFGLAPWIDADLHLFERAYEACKDRNFASLRQLERAALAVYEARSAQAFNGSILVDGVELQKLPPEISAETEAARAASTDLHLLASRGLEIKIPTDIPTEKYVELVKEFQPRIAAAVEAIVPTGSTEGAATELLKNVSAINAEIERIKGLRRYAVLEACSSFYKNNLMLLGGVLVATAMGVSGSLLGCAATGAVGTVANVAKKKGWLKESTELKRLGRLVARDLQPYTDAALSAYFASNTPAINVLSVRTQIKAAVNQ
jgi:hypothetical protein